jgi:hypothetical protein
MQRGSDKHGARVDDAMSNDVRGLTQAGHDPRAEEWRSAEPAGEDQPDVDRVPGSDSRAGAPDGMTPDDLDRRAELAAALGKEIWPADADEIQRKVQESNAPDRVRELVARLPRQRVYQGASEVWAVVTGEPPEERF